MMNATPAEIKPTLLPDEVVAGHRDDVPFTHVAQPVQDLRHAQRDGRLAGAGVAGEAHVQRRRRADEAEVAPGLVDHQERRRLADALLHRRKSDEFAVELLQHLLHMGVAQDRLQVDGRRAWSVHRLARLLVA